MEKTACSSPTKDSEALADAMARMIDQPQAAGKVEPGAKKIYQSQFTGEIFAKKVEQVYLETLKGVSHGTKRT